MKRNDILGILLLVGITIGLSLFCMGMHVLSELLRLIGTIGF